MPPLPPLLLLPLLSLVLTPLSTATMQAHLTSSSIACRPHLLESLQAVAATAGAAGWHPGTQAV
jgi:hypothetical protein